MKLKGLTEGRKVQRHKNFRYCKEFFLRHGKEVICIVFVFIVVMLCAQCSNNESEKVEAGNGNNKAISRVALPESFVGKIAFQSDQDGDNEIYLLDKTGVKKLTDNKYEDEYPLWDERGEMIVFKSNPSGKDNYDIYIMKADGSGLKALLATPNNECDASFTAKDPDTFAYGFNDREIHLYNTKTKEDVALPFSLEQRSILPICSPVNDDIIFTAKRWFGWDVALYESSTNSMRYLTDGGKSCRARWSHKGDRLAFVSHRADGKGDIWVMKADGSQQTRVTFDDKTYEYFPSWSPDDKQIVYASSVDKKKGNWALWIIDLESKKKWKVYDSPGQDKFPAWIK